jgi:hypothetical protein
VESRDEMKMIAHQTIGINLPACPCARLAEYFQKAISVDIVAKNCFPPVASIEEMIESAFVFDPDLAGHAAAFTTIAVCVSIVRTDPDWPPIALFQSRCLRAYN